MSSLSSYPTKAFKESQKFLVRDPSSGSTSFVLGSDLVSYITPRLNYVRSQSTRLAAESMDYEPGIVIQTTGESSIGDGKASTYLVVAPGEGDFPMLNGNELLSISTISISTQYNTLTDISSISTISQSSLNDGEPYSLASWRPNGYKGGGLLAWKDDELKSNHNGGTVFSVTVPPPVDFGDPVDVVGYLNGDGETDPFGRGCFVRIDDGPVDVFSFGVFGDGVTNDVEILKLAIKSGLKLINYDNSAVFKISDTLEVLGLKNLNIDLGGAKIDGSDVPNGTTGGAQKRVVSFGGEVNNTQTISVSLSQGDTTLPVSAEEGQLILLTADEPFIDGWPDNNKGELLRVDKVLSAFSVEVTPIFYSYTATNNIKAEVIDPLKSPLFKSCTVIGGGDSSFHAVVHFENAERIALNDVNVEYGEDRGFSIVTCFGGVIDKCSVYSVPSPHRGTSGSTFQSGYGATFSRGSRDFTLSRTSLTRTNTATTGGGGNVPSFNVTVDHCSSIYSYENGFTCHEPNLFWVFSENTIIRPADNGINERGLYTTLIGNRIVNAQKSAIRVIQFGAPIVDITANKGWTRVIGNVAVDTQDSANDGTIYIGPASDRPAVKNVIISGNTLTNSQKDGIRCIKVQRVVISGNNIEYNGAGLDFSFAVELSGTCSNVTTDSNIAQNILNGANSFFIRYSSEAPDTLRDVTITSNQHINGAGGVSFSNFDNTLDVDWVIVTSNNFRGSTGGTQGETPIEIDSTNTIVQNNFT